MIERKHITQRHAALLNDRQPYEDFWKTLYRTITGFNGRFLTEERDKPLRYRVINNTGKMAARTLAAGMLAGVSSPARPWFRLAPPDRELASYRPVKEWLHFVEQVMLDVFARSNLYVSLEKVYFEEGVVGTGAMSMFRDSQTVLRCYPHTIGAYALAQDERNVVDTIYRRYQRSVGQVVKQFGLENCSHAVQQQYKDGNFSQKVTIIHAVEPNDDRDHNKRNARNMRWRSVYVEEGQVAAGEEHRFLRRSGFEEFPSMTPRWDVMEGDTYAHDCAGAIALGDIQAYEVQEVKRARAVDNLADPPTRAHVSMRADIERQGVRPGSTLYYSDPSGKGIEAIYEFRHDLEAIRGDIKEMEFRVKRAFYEDLFLMLVNDDRRQITAREIAEKHEEKLLMLGPVLERNNGELLDPVIDRGFAIMQRAGLFPEPPPELTEVDLRVEYISILAQAQKLATSAGVGQVAAFAGEVSAVWPEARHKLDASKAIEEYADSVGVSPDVIRDDDEVAELVAQEQQTQQAAQMAAMAQPAAQGAQAMKTLSEVDTEEGIVAEMINP